MLSTVLTDSLSSSVLTSRGGGAGGAGGSGRSAGDLERDLSMAEGVGGTSEGAGPWLSLIYLYCAAAQRIETCTPIS